MSTTLRITVQFGDEIRQTKEIRNLPEGSLFSQVRPRFPVRKVPAPQDQHIELLGINGKFKIAA